MTDQMNDTTVSESNMDTVASILPPPPAVLGDTANTTIISLPVKSPQTVDPMFNIVKDIIFSLILTMPGLRTKLDDILKSPNMVIDEISKIFNEIQAKVPETEIDRLRQYISQDSSKTTILSILQTSFVEIMSDGKIDMNDANVFLNLIYNIIARFNDTSQNNFITISGDAIMFFIYFIVKSTIILCLDEEKETIAIELLDSSFKLVSIVVMPMTKMTCNPFKCLQKK